MALKKLKVDKTFRATLKKFLDDLTPDQRAALMEMLRRGVMPPWLKSTKENQKAMFAPIDFKYVAYVASVAGGVAGWLTGGGSASTIPWSDITTEAKKEWVDE